MKRRSCKKICCVSDCEKQEKHYNDMRNPVQRKHIARQILAIVLCLFGIFSVSCANTTTVNEREVLRLHIRANSNQSVDQQVKLVVRDRIIEYLSDLGANSVSEAKKLVIDRSERITRIATETLASNGMSYGARTILKNEYFPTRTYGDVTLESGYYDALIIELGSGKGDNWWCVIYPPLCYLEGGGSVRYKSVVKEWLGLS